MVHVPRTATASAPGLLGLPKSESFGRPKGFSPTTTSRRASARTTGGPLTSRRAAALAILQGALRQALPCLRQEQRGVHPSGIHRQDPGQGSVSLGPTTSVCRKPAGPEARLHPLRQTPRQGAASSKRASRSVTAPPRHCSKPRKLHHPLSQISKHQQRYPHQQIRDYLNEAQVLTWGILTNGNEWRLYCRDTKPSQFFALNFEVAIKSLEDFKYLPRAVQSRRLCTRRARANAGSTKSAKTRWPRRPNWKPTCASESSPSSRFSPTALLNARKTKSPMPTCRAFTKTASSFFTACCSFSMPKAARCCPSNAANRKYYKELSLARLIGPLKNFAIRQSTPQTRLYRDILELCHLINGTDEKANT